MLLQAALLRPPAAIADPLIARIRAGERAALAEVYDAHHAALRAFARRVTGDEVAAEDLVHDAFVALPRAIRSYRGDAPLRSFLLGVALNHSRHHIRAAARRRQAMARHAAAVHDVGATAATPDDDLRRRQLAARLALALDQLPRDQRVAFIMCELEERSAAEAGEIAGAPEATIRTRVFHARRKLRALLEAP